MTGKQELESMWKEVVMATFMALFEHFPRRLEESDEKPQSAESVSMLRFESVTFRIRKSDTVQSSMASVVY
jgi:hypothetical protein